MTLGRLVDGFVDPFDVRQKRNVGFNMGPARLDVVWVIFLLDHHLVKFFPDFFLRRISQKLQQRLHPATVKRIVGRGDREAES